MRIFKRVLPCVLFIAVLILVNLTLNYLLIPYEFTRMKIHAIETASCDDLILGSSHGGTNIDPSVLSGVTGRTAFNAAQGEEYSVDSYYLLKDACREHKPGRVIYEFDPSYWLSAQEVDANYAGMFYNMQMSPVKMEYFWAKMWKSDFRTFCAPWYFYRNRAGDMANTVYIKNSEDYKSYGTSVFESERQSVKADGFISLKRVRWDDEITVRAWNDDTIQREDEKYFIKIAEFCRDNGIELVTVTTPLPDSTYEAGKENFDRSGQYMQKLAGEYGFSYMDYNTDRIEGLDVSDSAYADYDGHMYAETADRFSVVLAGYLKNLQDGA